MARIEAGLHDFEDFSPVAPGTYDFVIKEPMQVIPNVTEKTDIGGKMFQFVIYPEVVGGPLAGKKVRRQFSNRSKGSRYFMKSFMDKVGVAITKEGAFNSEELLGRQFKATVNERMYTDKEGNSKKGSDLDSESVVAI